MGIFDQFMGGSTDTAPVEDTSGTPPPDMAALLAQAGAAMNQPPPDTSTGMASPLAGMDLSSIFGASGPPPDAPPPDAMAALLSSAGAALPGPGGAAPGAPAAPAPYQVTPATPAPAMQGPPLPPVTGQGIPSLGGVANLMAQSTQQQGQAIDRETQAAIDKQDYLRVERTKALQAQQEAADADMAARKRIGEEKAAKDAALAEESKRLAAMKPDSFYKSQSTLQNLGTLIAVGLGGYEQSKTGGRNVAMEFIQKEVEAHTAEQTRQHMAQVEDLKARTEASDKSFAGQLNAADVHTLYLAENVKRVNAQIDAQASLYDDPAVRARGDAMKAANLQVSANSQLALQQANNTQAMQRAQLAQGAAGLKEQTRQFDLNLEQKKEEALRAGNVAEFKRLQEVKDRSIPGFVDPATGQAAQTTDVEAAKHRTILGTADQAYSTAQQMLDLTSDKGWSERLKEGVLDVEDKRRYNVLAQSLQGSMRKLQDTGQMRAADVDKLENVLKFKFGSETNVLHGNQADLEQLKGSIFTNANLGVRAETGIKEGLWTPTAGLPSEKYTPLLKSKARSIQPGPPPVPQSPDVPSFGNAAAASQMRSMMGVGLFPPAPAAKPGRTRVQAQQDAARSAATMAGVPGSTPEDYTALLARLAKGFQ